MSEPIARPPPPTFFINVSPTIAPKMTNTIRQEGIATLLAGVVIGLALALTYTRSVETRHDG